MQWCITVSSFWVFYIIIFDLILAQRCKIAAAYAAHTAAPTAASASLKSKEKRPEKRSKVLRLTKRCSVALKRIPADLPAVEENISDDVLVPVAPPAKRNRRFKSCIDSFILETRDRFQELDKNPVILPMANVRNAQCNSGRNSTASSLKVIEREKQCESLVEINAATAIVPSNNGRSDCEPINQRQSPAEVGANVTDGSLIPVPLPVKRVRRIMSCVDPFILEIRDQFQELDKNPVMQSRNSPVQVGENSASNDVTEIKPPPSANNKLSAAVCQPHVSSELIPTTVSLEKQKQKCLKCIAYQQNNGQLKKKVECLERDAIFSKQKYEKDLRNVQLENAISRSEVCQQIDELQDECARLLTENHNLRNARL